MKLITINNTKDVEAFCQFLYNEYDLAFHPDDSFQMYIDAHGQELFTKEEAGYLDSIMERCFDVCEQAGTNVYECDGTYTESGVQQTRNYDLIH